MFTSLPLGCGFDTAEDKIVWDLNFGSDMIAVGGFSAGLSPRSGFPRIVDLYGTGTGAALPSLANHGPPVWF